MIASLFAGSANGATATWTGFVTTTGTLAVTSDVFVHNEVLLYGGGVILLAGTAGPVQMDGNPADPAASAYLYNWKDTLTGTGYLGSTDEGTPGLEEVNNAATILATSGGWIIINPDANRGVLNEGLIESSNGGYVGIYGEVNDSNLLTPVNNNGGTITATGTGTSDGPIVAGVNGSGSIVELSSVNFANGKLSGSNGGVLLFDTETTATNATITLSGDNSQVDVGLSSYGLTPDVTFLDVTITGSNNPGEGVWVEGNGGNGPTYFQTVNFLGKVPVNLVGANLLVTGGTLTNTGTMSFDDPNNISGQASSITISGTLKLTGTGTVSLLDNSQGAPQHQIEGDPSDAADTDELINVNNTITGTGYIGGNQPGTPGLLALVNEATITAGTNDTLVINPDGDLGIVNTGRIQANNGGNIWLVGGGNNNGGITPITNTGGTIVAAGSGPNSGPVNAGATGSSSIVEFSSVDLSYGALTASNGGVLLFDTASVINGATINLTGSDSQVNLGNLAGSLTPDVTFNTVTLSASGSSIGQGVWVEGNGGTGPTVFNQVSFLNGMAVNLVNANVLVTGTLVNTGTMSFDDPDNQSGEASSMAISGTVTLTGSGTVDLFNNSDGTPQHQIDGNPEDNSDTDELVNVNNTITGNGYLGGTGTGTAGLMMLTNEATIVSGSDDAIVIDPAPDLGAINTGVIKAIGGGYVGFYGEVNNNGNLTPINNTGGSIVAAGGGPNDGPYNSGASGTASIVEFSTVELTGGTLTGSGGGGLLFDAGAIVNNAAISLTGDNSQVNVGVYVNATSQTPDVTFNNVAFTGDGSPVGQGIWVYNYSGNYLTMFNSVSILGGLAVDLVNANLVVSGTLINSGTFSFDDPNNPSDQSSYMALSGTVTLTGSGTINLFNNSSGIAEHQIDADPSESPSTAELINVNNTITGTGYIGANQYESSSLLLLKNEGTILAASGDTLMIDPDAALGVVNTGLIKASGGGYVGVSGTGGETPVNNTGGSIVASGTGSDAGPVHAGANSDSSIVELYSVDVTGGSLTGSNGGVLLFDTGSIVNNASVFLTGDNSQVNVGLSGSILTPDVDFNNVSFTGDGSPVGQGVWVSGSGGNGPTTFSNVSFLGGVAVNLVGANVLVTGTLANTGLLSFDYPAAPSGYSSSIIVSGTVMLSGSGTVNLLKNGGNPGHVIDGNYNAAHVSQNVLVNGNNTIEGTGFIGGTPSGSGSSVSYSSAMQFVNDGTVLATASNDITMIAGPTTQGAAASPIQNQGAMVIAAGGLMGVIGNYSQGSGGYLETAIGGLTVESTSNLGSAASYSAFSVTGTATLNGAFEVSLTNGFAPQLGNVFSVVNAGYLSGQFSGYQGLLLSSSLVLEPSYTSTGLILTVTAETPGTSATLRPVAPGGSTSVTSGSSYAGITSTSTLAGGNGTVLTVLGGTATSSTSISINFQAAGNFAASKGGILVSDIANFQGTGTNTFVLQLSYNPAAIAASQNMTLLTLAWLNPVTNSWINAVFGNTGNSVPREILGAYNPATDFVLGDYGVDSVDDRVWAVIDHNSEFAVEDVPEPGTWALVGLAGAVIAGGGVLKGRR